MRARLALILVVQLGGVAAFSSARAETVTPSVPAPDQRCVPHQQAPGEQQTEGRAPGNGLSERLARSGGVICPPEVEDRDIRRPTPDTGRTPVIPPTEVPPNSPERPQTPP